MPQETTSELFNQALAQLQQKNWDASIALYRQLLDQGRDSLSSAQASVVYHNMSTIAAEKADTLMAYVWAKKALLLDPANSEPHAAFQQYAAQFQVPSLPHQISNLDNFMSVVGRVPLDIWLGLTLILILLTLWLIAKKWIQIKKNSLSDVFVRSATWPVYVTGLITIAFFIVSYFTFNESQITHAVLISDKVGIQTAPGENKPVIFEAPQGLDVEVLKQEGDYFQVRSKGAFSGWIGKKQLELMSLRFEQH